MKTPAAHVRAMPFYQKWLILGILIGIAAGIGALIFYFLLDFVQTLFLTDFVGMTIPSAVGDYGAGGLSFSPGTWYLIPLSLIIGGLVSGFFVYRFAPDAAGHGTDSAINSFHNKKGKISRSVPIIKTIASAFTIGSGGSAGREGPASQISAGIGSWMADVFRLDDKERRIALLAGLGAGIGTIFKAPIGGAILAMEIPYKGDFESAVIFPAIVASAVGYSIFGSVVGFQPIFGYYLGVFAIGSLPLYAILGAVTGIMAIFYIKAFYAIDDNFKKLGISNYFKPALGALVVGIIAIAFPEVLATGYGWIQLMINGSFSAFPTFGLPILFLLIMLVFAKIFATSLTIGSGGSGGVFGPGMFIGATIGAVVGLVLHLGFPALVPSIAPFVIIGMLAFFGGAAKVPIAMLLVVTEMTGSLQILPAAMIAVAISYLVSGKYTIYKSQIPERKEKLVVRT